MIGHFFIVLRRPSNLMAPVVEDWPQSCIAYGFLLACREEKLTVDIVTVQSLAEPADLPKGQLLVATCEYSLNLVPCYNKLRWETRMMVGSCEQGCLTRYDEVSKERGCLPTAHRIQLFQRRNKDGKTTKGKRFGAEDRWRTVGF